jgi:hypothetical protein
MGAEDAMTGYHCSRIQALDLIQRVELLAPGVFIALREIGVRVVIGSIPRNHEVNRRNIQRG